MLDENAAIIPLGNRIIVRLVQAAAQVTATVAGAEALGEVAVRGVVIAAGAGRVDERGRRVPLSIAAGDVIMFATDRARKLTFGGMQCWVIDADEIVNVEASGTKPLLRSKSHRSPP